MDHVHQLNHPGNHSEHHSPNKPINENDSHQQHDKHRGHSLRDFLKRFWISTALTLPVLLLSHSIQTWLGINFLFQGQKYLVLVLATTIYFYGGYPFLKGAYDEVKFKRPGMMTLICVAITVSWAYSVSVAFGLKGMDFFWEMATLIDIMLIGHYFEMKSVMNASKSLELLVKLLPSNANLIVDEGTKDVPIELLKKGDFIKIKPGEKIPVDGLVVDGESYLDESMLTGESLPVKKVKDSRIIGGSLNGAGQLTVKVTGIGKDSYLHKIISLVSDAQHSKSNSQALADKAARVLTYVALGTGILTLIIWLSLGFSFSLALERMVTVMVISCPHALGLAIPLVVAISTNHAARNGLLIKNRTAFENSRLITIVLFDKTGTLTQGVHELHKIEILDNKTSEHELLSLAAAIEQHSEHFIAEGILMEAKKRKLKILESEAFKYIPGEGVEGKVNGKRILIVGPNYFRKHKVEVPEVDTERHQTIIYVIEKEEIIGYFTFTDKIRKESQDAIKSLKELGIKSILITGDNEAVAKNVSEELNMDGYSANVLPHEKLNEIVKLQKRGEYVAMAGDGVNDAPALAKADVGIAIGSGTEIASESADIILVNSNPKDVANAIVFGQVTYKKMQQNLWWAAGYNIIAIPLATGIFYSWGFILSPAVGAILMSASTLIVAFNAQLLRWRFYKLVKREK